MRKLGPLLLVAAVCGGAGTPGSQLPEPTLPASPAAPTTLAPVDEAAVKARSRAFFDALDRDDAAFADVLAPSFVLFMDGRFIDRELIASAVARRRDRKAPARTRTWKDESVFISPAAAVYIAEGVEHIPAEGDAKALDRAGWHTLIWVQEGGSWKIVHYQWQKGGLDAERDFWNERYRQGTGFETGPNRLLVATVEKRKPGAALDIMMGQGRNAIFLASQGWKVTGVDISDEGLRIANETAGKRELAISTIQADVNEWDPGIAKWDLVAMIYAGVDPELVERTKPSLKKGGLFVLEGFHADSAMAKIGGGWKDGQLAALFKEGYKILRDDVVEDTADWSLTKQKLVRFVAEKL